MPCNVPDPSLQGTNLPGVDCEQTACPLSFVCHDQTEWAFPTLPQRLQLVEETFAVRSDSRLVLGHFLWVTLRKLLIWLSSYW